MSPKARNNKKSKLRMDDYSSSDKVSRQKRVSNPRREIDNVIKKARKDGTQSSFWTKKLLEVEEKEPDRWRHSGYKELYASSSESEKSSKGSPVAKKRTTMYSPSAPTSPNPARSSRRSLSNTRRNDRRSVSSDMRRSSSRPRTDKFSSSTRTRTSMSPIRRPAKSPNRSNRSPARRSRSPLRRNRSPVRRISPAAHRNATSSRNRKSSPVRRLKSPHVRSVEKASSTIRRKKSPKLPRYKTAASRSPITKSPVRRISKARSRSPLPSKSSKRKNTEYRMRARDSSSSESGLSSRSPAQFRTKKGRSKPVPSKDVLSSSDCSDSNCSMCIFEKNAKEKRSKKTKKDKVKRPGPPPPEPKLKPRAQLPRLPPPMSSRYARSKSFSPVVSSPVNERQVEIKQHKKKSSKKEKKKTVVKASKEITTPIIHHKKIKVESPSDESESPSPKRISLSDRFGKMAKWNQKKDFESNQRNIRVTADDNYRVEELDVPLLERFPEPSPMLLDGPWEDVRVRYAHYKDQGLLEDLTFQDYLKWEEWWYSYQEWLGQDRMHSFRRL